MKTHALSMLVGFDLLIDTEDLQTLLDALVNNMAQIRITYELNGETIESVSDMVSEVQFTHISGDGE